MALRHAALVGLAVALSAAMPSAAAAADLTVTPNSCLRYIKPYTNVPATPSFGLTTAGWAPGSALDVLVGGHSVGSVQADATGAYSAAFAFSPPKPPKGKNIWSAPLRVRDAAGTTRVVPVKVVRLTVDVPDRARPSQRVVYKAFGFSPKRAIHLFIRRGRKVLKRVALGKPHGECGRLNKKLRYMPLKRYRVGTYSFEFTQTRKYDPGQVLASYALVLTKHKG